MWVFYCTVLVASAASDEKYSCPAEIPQVTTVYFPLTITVYPLAEDGTYYRNMSDSSISKDTGDGDIVILEKLSKKASGSFTPCTSLNPACFPSKCPVETSLKPIHYK